MSEELNLLLSKIESQLEQKGILNKKMSRSCNFTMKDNLKKEMEQKILNETTYKDEINKTNNNVNTSIEYETHKLIEKELEPYLNSIRKELKVTVQSIQSVIGEYTNNKDEIDSLKEIVSTNRETIAKIENDIQCNRKIMKGDINRMSSEIKKKNTEIVELRKSNKELKLKCEELQQSIFNINENSERDEKIRKSEETMVNNMKKLEKSMNQNLAKLATNVKQTNEELNNEIKLIKDEINDIKEEHENKLQEIESTIQLLKEEDNNNEEVEDLKNKLNALLKEFELYKDDVPSVDNKIINAKLKPINDKLSSNTKDISTLNDTLTTLSEINKEFATSVSSLEERLLKVEQNPQNSKRTTTNNKEIEELQEKLKEICSTLNESNTQFISQLTTINNSLNEFREHQLEANEINEKTIVCLGDQMVSLLKVIKALESNKEETDENFEEIQNGFDKVENIIIKVPKIEKDYLLLNEFIVELTKKYQELNIKIDTGLNNVTEWESGLVENITNKMNEIIDDYEKKIMKTSQQIQSSRTETTDIRIDPKKADNSINDKSDNNISNIGGFDFDN